MSECTIKLVVKKSIKFWTDGIFFKASNVSCDPSISIIDLVINAYRFEDEDIAIEGQETISISLNLLFNYETKVIDVSAKRNSTTPNIDHQYTNDQLVDWFDFKSSLVDANNSDVIKYYLITAYVFQMIIFAAIMFTKVPRQ